MDPKAHESYLPDDTLRLYEVRNHRHAVEILANSCAQEFAEIMNALRIFRLTLADITKPGGNQSDIPKRITSLLRPLKWYETRISGDLHVRLVAGKPKQGVEGEEAELEVLKEGSITKKGYIDGHKIDYVKGRVAFDIEWNSKEQTFDRDLAAFRAFYDCDVIDAGVLLTRSAEFEQGFCDTWSSVGQEWEAITETGRQAEVDSK
jgi:hypothetical protein